MHLRAVTSSRKLTARIRPAVLVLLAACLVGCQRGAVPALADEPALSSKRAASEDVSSPDQSTASDDPTATTTAKPAAPADNALPENPFSRRVKAPPLSGGVAWINTAGPLELEALRGKFVLLDFWTYCCINCMHILPELKKLEHAYPNELVVIGVHSAKFETEEESKNITEAVLRYEIEHPVVNDAEHAIWSRFGVSSWPTVLLIDPEGYAVYATSGEIEFELFDYIMKMAVPYYRAKGVLDETPLRFDLEAYKAQDTPLRFPGKILADEAGGRLFIADSNHNRLVISTLDGQVIDVIGSSEIGKADGNFASASFNKPQGMALDGNSLYVADTENHLIRKIDLSKREVATIAGTGRQARGGWPGIEIAPDGSGAASLPERFVGKPLETAINSPWALWVHGQDLYIAMAGPHQIWKMPLNASEIGPYAGNGREDIVDGALLPSEPYEMGFSSFAQPSGLASDGKWLYVADSEGSSIRAVPFDPRGEVKTVIGTAHLEYGRLFAFGDVDGDSSKAKLQHALGVVFYERMLYVADTYNDKIKVIDFAKRTATTIAGTGEPGFADTPPQFDEPAGIAAARGKLYVADTNNHAIRTVDLRNGNRVATLEIAGLAPPEAREPETAAPLAVEAVKMPQASVRPVDGKVRLAVTIELPAGFKMNALAPLRYRVEAVGDASPIDSMNLGQSVNVEPIADQFEVNVPLVADVGQATIRLTVTYYYCQEGAEGLCKVGTAAWEVPLAIAADGSSEPVGLSTQGK